MNTGDLVFDSKTKRLGTVVRWGRNSAEVVLDGYGLVSCGPISMATDFTKVPTSDIR